MRKKLSRLMTFAFVLVMAVTLIAPISAHAVDLPDQPDPNQKYDIVLTKLVQTVEGEWPEIGKYDGSQIDIPTGYTTLEGVWFDIYKLDEQGNESLVPGKSGKTDENGVLEFKGLEAGTYIIKEDKARSEIPVDDDGEIAHTKALPMTIELPVFKKDGGYFTTTEDENALYVYPKNTIDKPTADKDVTEIGNKDDNVDYGEPITWIITSKLPEGIEDYKVFKFTDKLTYLDFIAGSTKIGFCETDEDGNLIEGAPFEDLTGITIEEPSVDNENTLTVDFIDHANDNQCYFGAEDAGKTIYIKFQTTISEDAPISEPIPNNVKPVQL